jgi:hypothetical protein
VRTEVTIHFDGTELLGDPRTVLESIGCGPDVADISEALVLKRLPIYVTLDETDERLPKLLALLEQHGADWWEGRHDCFTDEELEAASLLAMSYDINATVFGGPRMGTTYDMSEACERCGAGARQTSAMIIEGEDLHKLEGRRAATTPYDDMLVDEKLAATLAESGATGISFRSVFVAFEKRGHLQLPWRQLCATHTMPPMSPRSIGIEPNALCICGRSGFNTTNLVYRASDLVEVQDVNVTWEWYGYSKFNGDVHDSVLPSPFFLVTPKVWRIFQDAGVTGFDWIPIRVVDE